MILWPPSVGPILSDQCLSIPRQGEKARERSLQHPTPCTVIQLEVRVRAIPQAWTEARLHCEECRPESLLKYQGPVGRTTSTLSVHREVVAVGKDLRHQVSRRFYHSVDSLGNEGKICALYIPDPKTVLVERPTCSLPV